MSSISGRKIVSLTRLFPKFEMKNVVYLYLFLKMYLCAGMYVLQDAHVKVRGWLAE